MSKKILILICTILAEINGQLSGMPQLPLTTPSPLKLLLPQSDPVAAASGLDKLLSYDPSTVQTIDTKQLATTLVSPIEMIMNDLNKTVDIFTVAKLKDLNKFVNTTMVGFKDAGEKLSSWLKQQQELYIGGGLKVGLEYLKNGLNWFADCKVQHSHDSFDIIWQLFAGNTKNLGCFAANVGTKAVGTGNVLTTITDNLNKLLDNIKKLLASL